MPSEKVTNPKAFAVFFVAFVFVASFVVCFTIGGTLYAEEHPKVLIYASSTCRVQVSVHKTYRCKTRSVSYSCYGAQWTVTHGANSTIKAKIAETYRYRSLSDALKKQAEYQVGSSYACWYSKKIPTVAQWGKPSVLVGTIFLICGGLSTLLAITLFYLSYQFGKPKDAEIQPDNFFTASCPVV